jgi:hypothetical protein
MIVYLMEILQVQVSFVVSIILLENRTDLFFGLI